MRERAEKKGLPEPHAANARTGMKTRASKRKLEGKRVYYSGELLNRQNLRPTVEGFLRVRDPERRRRGIGRPSHRLSIAYKRNHVYYRDTNLMTDADLQNEALHLIANRLLRIRFVARARASAPLTTQAGDYIVRGDDQLVPLIEYREGPEKHVVRLSKARERFRNQRFLLNNKEISWFPLWEELIRHRVLNEI